MTINRSVQFENCSCIQFHTVARNSRQLCTMELRLETLTFNISTLIKYLLLSSNSNKTLRLHTKGIFKFLTDVYILHRGHFHRCLHSTSERKTSKCLDDGRLYLHCSIYYIDVPQILVGTVYYTARTYPTNKTQVFNEISIMENWLINSRTLLVLYSW